MVANGLTFMLWTDVYWEETIGWVSTVIRVKVSMGDCVLVCALWSSGTVVGVVRWAEFCLDPRYTGRRTNLKILPNAFIYSVLGHFSPGVQNQHWWGLCSLHSKLCENTLKQVDNCISLTLLSSTATRENRDLFLLQILAITRIKQSLNNCLLSLRIPCNIIN